MKVLVINALSALRGGGQTYIKNFLNHLPEGDFKILLLVNTKNKHVFEPFSSNKVELIELPWASKSIIHRTLWEHISLPNFLKNKKATVYYAPGGTMTTKIPKGIISATALRNMLPFDKRERERFPLFSYIRFKLWLLRFVFLRSYKMSDKVVFISNYSKTVVKEYISNIEQKSVVVPHGLNESFLNAKGTYDLPDFLQKDDFYLYVSILDVYKAQKEVIQSWKVLVDKGLNTPLVLVGPKYNTYGEEVIQLIEELQLSDYVKYLGAVDYEHLPDLYKTAKGLIFASSCECCPNILLEKLAAGKPVICSDIEPMPEFGEDAAVYFNPYNPNSLVDQIQILENNPSIMKDIAQKASKQAQKFNWYKTVEETLSFLLN